MKKKLYIFFLLTIVSGIVMAQGRRMPLADVPVSPYALGVGNAAKGHVPGSYVYGSKAAILYTDNKASEAEYAFGLVDNATERYMLHTVSGAHHFGHNAIMGGLRYYSMGSIDRMVDVNLQPVGGKKRFYTYSADLGYARALDSHWGVYATLNVATEKIISTMNAYGMELGGSFAGRVKTVDYMLGLSVSRLGAYAYNGKSGLLSPLVSGGGSVSVPFSSLHRVSILVDGGVYIPVKEAKTAATFGGGIDYTLHDTYSLRVGGHTGEDDNYLSAGIGVRVGRFTLDVAAKLALEQGLANMYMAGLRVNW
ncbi:MAG TPA: hypothetical protein VIQ97_03495 [Prevotella sp.]